MAKLYKSVAILTLLVVLVCLYQWWSSGSVIAQSFRNNRTLSRFDVERFTFWRGENAFRDFLVEKSNDSDLLFFDGQNRWAYVLKSRHEHHQNNSDLCQFGLLNGPQIGMIWRGPAAARIDDVEFVPNKVEITIAMTAHSLGSRTSIVDWEFIESESGSGHLQDYFANAPSGKPN